jgi:hypothetical protein
MLVVQSKYGDLCHLQVKVDSGDFTISGGESSGNLSILVNRILN